MSDLKYIFIFKNKICVTSNIVLLIIRIVRFL